MNAFNTGNYKNVTKSGLYIGTAACTLDGIDDMLLKYGTKLTKTPANYIGIGETKGSIEIGKEADILMIDKGLNVETVMLHGNIIY